MEKFIKRASDRINNARAQAEMNAEYGLSFPFNTMDEQWSSSIFQLACARKILEKYPDQKLQNEVNDLEERFPKLKETNLMDQMQLSNLENELNF